MHSIPADSLLVSSTNIAWPGEWREGVSISIPTDMVVEVKSTINSINVLDQSKSARSY
jgi:hypothetical protein